MKWAALFGISFIVFCILLFQWPKLKTNQKKEKIALISILALGWGLAVMLVFFPDTPGPTEFIYALFHPLEYIFG